MELRLQPNPEVEIRPADKGIVSAKEYFVKKEYEEIRPYFFPGLFIRDWKPKAELIYPRVPDENEVRYACDFNRNVQSCFIEDNAEEVYLRSPPPCFVVFGKSSPSVRKLSKDIADEYGSVLIEAEEIVGQVLKDENETSKFVDKLLRLGLSLTLNFVLALISFAAHTAEARHRGYVLCGLPAFPYQYELSPESQINYLFSWDNKPTVFVNVLFEDEDLVHSRTNIRCELETFEDKTRIVLHSDYDRKEEAEEEEEEDDDDDEIESDEVKPVEPDIDISPSRPWIQLPKDEESQVWSELEVFNSSIKPVLDMFRSRIDPQYYITVDSRVENTFDIIRARLRLLPIWKPPNPFPFIPPKEPKMMEKSSEEQAEEKQELEEEMLESEEEMEIRSVIGEPPEIAFLKLFNKKTVSPKFRWELSHYNYMCPVSLRSGFIVEGKSEFAVVFLKYIFFLRDEECMRQFLRNPRYYVLPVRPKPAYKFFVLGYPFCGKTTLAQCLAEEFSITLIDVDVILRTDLERKKTTYQEFCRQKAECREIIRLTARAWQDWRLEEEQRLALIETWIEFIQSLLIQRIEQFYSLPRGDDKKTEVYAYSSMSSRDKLGLMGEGGEQSLWSLCKSSTDFLQNTLELRGVAINPIGGPYDREHTPVDNQSTPSTKIIQAMKHENYNFNENGLEIEANLFFSSLWNAFSDSAQILPSKKFHKMEELKGEEEEEENKSMYGELFDDRSISTINWCNLLPPQSLSSFLLKKIPCTVKERRESFSVLLEAAAKVYWEPSALKTEFAKWRLPCFMDIPLCEVFLNNPYLLYRYCPEWLKERPLIPDPVDPIHPSVMEAGRLAFNRAGVVTVIHKKEEVFKLVRNAIEKVEREGIRVTGEVITPGGWVIDNMVMDQEVWCALIRENVFADYIYILTEQNSDPEHKRIINLWYDLHRQSESKVTSLTQIASEEESNLEDLEDLDVSSTEKLEMEKYAPIEESNLANLLKESCEVIEQGDQELDELYRLIQEEIKQLPFEFSTPDPFTRNFVQDILESIGDLTKEEISNEELTLGIQSLTDSSHYLFSNRQITTSVHNFPIGTHLLLFTNKIINALKKVPATEKIKKPLETLEDQINFFVSLLILPEQLEKIKELLNSVNKGEMVTEIDIQGKTTEKIFEDIKKVLNRHFLKKPRELESFEMKETLDELERKRNKVKRTEMEDEEEGEAEEENQEEVEDICIYGESGPFCIVNLERDILLKGKPEYVLRYYGKLYFFYNQDAKDKFIEDPEKYAPYYSAIRCLPPLRIFVVGPVGSGKTSLAHSVANQCSVDYVDYLSLINNRLIPNSDPGCYKIKALSHNKLLLSEEHNDEAKEAIVRFMNAPYEKQRFWLENPLEANEQNMQKEIWENMNLSRSTLLPANYPTPDYKCVEPTKEDKFTLSEMEIVKKDRPFISMNEIKEMLENYIENKTEMTPYCVNKSLAVLWKEFPYVTQGFVLKGFPMRLFDVRNMIENNWLPDMIINVSASEQTVIEKNLDDAMEVWKANLTQEMQEEELLEDTLQTIQKSMISIRRVQLLNEKRNFALKNLSSFNLEEENTLHFDKNISESEVGTSKRRGSTKGVLKYEERKFFESAEDSQTEKVSSDPVLPHGVEAKILAEVEEEIQQEFKPMVFKPIYETPEAGKARIMADYELNYRRDMEELTKIKSALQDVDIPWYDIDASKDLKRSLTDLFIELDKVRKRYGERGEFAFNVKMSTAEKLLEQGYYFLSKFGRWCPVQVYRMKNSIHMYLPLESRGKIIPVVYRNYVYFVGGENEKKHFLGDPIKYTFNEPHHPNIPLRVAVIGPPKSGKSTLSSRLGLMFGLKVVTLGTAIRFVLNMSDCKLRREMDGYLKRGCFLPLSLKIEAIIACLNDPACVTQGFVFDGIPFDAALTQSLAEEGKLPFVILSLICCPYFGKLNREKLDLTRFRLPYKQRVNLDNKYAEWKETYERYVQWNQDTYNNLFELNAKLSVIDIFYQAYDIIKKAYFGILYYVEHCVTDKALPLQYLCVSQHEWELRKSSFYSNCPVCWFEVERLICSTDPPSRSGLVQYLNYFYWICHNHMEKFLKEPKKYLPPNAPEPPKLIPKIIKKSEYETSSMQLLLHGNGRCPVTRVDFPDSLDWEGSWDYAASYDNEIFLCKNEEMLQRFMARPWRYCHADTKFEVNRPEKSEAIVNLGPPLVTSLPPIGFLEQTVADLIHQALQITGAVRPIYPGLTPTCSGCTFVGLYLKVHNKKNKTPHLEKSCLDFMLYYCQANKFHIPLLRSRRDNSIRDTEPEPPDSNDSTPSEEEEDAGRASKMSRNSRRNSVTTEQGIEPCWLDLESQADKKMWSAKLVSPNLTKMALVDDKLEEVPGLPKEIVVLRFQTYSMRPSPLPPVSGCCTVLYSCKPGVQLPEKFNINTLYQPLADFSSPNPTKIPFNPEKEFPHMLAISDKAPFKSEFTLWKKQRYVSDEALGDFIFPEPKGDPDLRFMIERFVPRFQLLDKMHYVEAPRTPKVVDTKPIVFDPHRDYNYTLLMSKFFHLNRVLKCYEWDDSKYLLEFQAKVDKNLGLCNVRSRFFFHPEIKSSMKSLSSKDSYQKTIQTFQFFNDLEDIRPSSASVKTDDANSSVINFIQSMIFHKLEDMFSRVSLSNLSYDSYEMQMIATDSDSGIITRPTILIREIYPYPPLPWDIDSIPYYAYCSIPPLFDVFHLENIAHERHVSLLDGIREPYDRFKFVRYPTWVQQKETQPEIPLPTHKRRKSCWKGKDIEVFNPVYDYFNIHWTSFLTNPFAWDYNADIKANFCGAEKDTDSQSLDETV